MTPAPLKTPTPIFTSVWGECAKIAIRIVEDGKALDPPLIVCTMCDATLTTLADLDTVAALITLAVEHTCTVSPE